MELIKKLLYDFSKFGVDFNATKPYLDTDFGYKYLCLDLFATEGNLEAFESTKHKFVIFAKEEYGFNAEASELGKIEFAVPYAKSNGAGGYDYLDNSDCLNDAVKAIEQSQHDELFQDIKKITKNDTLKEKISNVWQNPDDRKDIIWITCVAGVLTIVGAISLTYYKNRWQLRTQANKSKKKQIAEATKKTLTSPKTWVATACVTASAIVLTILCKIRPK